MAAISVRPFAPERASEWDALCATTHQATFLHTRRFLAYHGQRFSDRSLEILIDGELAGLLPAAADREDAATVVSHPGATYGGIAHDARLSGSAMIEALQACVDHYRAAGAHRLRYKAVPHIYHRVPAGDDLYALFRLGAQLVRRDLSCAIDLGFRPPLSSRRARGMVKARRQGVVCTDGFEDRKSVV